jgi:hypothetical protein
MSLVDMCRIEKKNPLPEIPLIKEPAIFDQEMQNWYKCMISGELAKEVTLDEPDWDNVDCSPGGYMAMIDETYRKLRLRSKKSAPTSPLATSLEKLANAPVSLATSSSKQTTSSSVQATLSSK